MLEQSFENITGIIIGVVSALIGGWDFTLQVLLILIAIDILTGVFKGLHGFAFTSKQFREGLVTKAGYILILILCFQLDTLMGNTDPVIRTVVTIFYISVEGSSIIENLGAVGVPIPEVIRERLAKLHDVADETSPSELKDTFQK
jgi:toxin secretion/phage lysis holin